jgi:hypothetical protein
MTSTSLADGDFGSVLQMVDDKPPSEEVLKSVLEAFEKVGVTSNGALVGASDADVDALFQGAPLTTRAFAKRALWAANAAAEIKRRKLIHTNSDPALAGCGNQTAMPDLSLLPKYQLPSSEVQLVTDLVGADASASAIAKLLAEPALVIDIPNLLQTAGMQGLDFHLQPALEVWKILEADNRAAKKVNRIAFTYMDLTSKPFLPMWLPQDSIGGKSILGSEWGNMSAGSHDGTLQQLGAA